MTISAKARHPTTRARHRAAARLATLAAAALCASGLTASAALAADEETCPSGPHATGAGEAQNLVGARLAALGYRANLQTTMQGKVLGATCELGVWSVGVVLREGSRTYRGTVLVDSQSGRLVTREDAEARFAALSETGEQD